MAEFGDLSPRGPSEDDSSLPNTATAQSVANASSSTTSSHLGSLTDFLVNLGDAAEREFLPWEHQAAVCLCTLKYPNSYFNRSFERFMYCSPDSTESRGAVFVIQAIASIRELEKLSSFLAAVASPVHVAQRRIVVMLNANYPDFSSTRSKQPKAELVKRQQAMIEPVARARAEMAKFMQANDDYPICVNFESFRAVFKKDKVLGTFALQFPYGTMRNSLLQSAIFRQIVASLRQSGRPIYVSFQDFDSGTRQVNGRHVLERIDAILSCGLRSREQQEPGDDSFTFAIRPLCIAGGYKPAAWTREDLESRINGDPKLAPDKRAELIGKLEKVDIEGLAGYIASLVDRDMRTRDLYSSLDPLLAYFPEPNLFLDATAVVASRELNGERIDLRFGPGAAEAAHLMSAIAKYSESEIRDYWQVNPRPIEREAQITACIMNNRHPVREVSIVTDFALRVETDATRLAYGFFKKGSLPQDHSSLAKLQEQMFLRKGDKMGAEFAPTLKRLKELPDLRTAFATQASENVSASSSSSHEMQDLMRTAHSDGRERTYGATGRMSLASGNLTDQQKSQVVSTALLSITAMQSDPAHAIVRPSMITASDVSRGERKTAPRKRPRAARDDDDEVDEDSSDD